LAEELPSSKAELEQRLPWPVCDFAFPDGNYNAAVVEATTAICRHNGLRKSRAGGLSTGSLPISRTRPQRIRLDFWSGSRAHLRLAATPIGIDLDAHRSRQVSSLDVKAADVVLLMDAPNCVEFRNQFPRDTDKVLFLGMFLSPGREISQPVRREYPADSSNS
jgi:Low molecular weight phosphotyrosine protein phosphatase